MIRCLSINEKSEDQNVNIQSRNFKYQSDMLLGIGGINSRIYVPNYESLRTEVIIENHGEGHIDIEKTYNNCARLLYWPNMYQEITKYMNSCSC